MRWDDFIDPSATGYGTYIQMKNQYLQSTNQIAELDNKEQQLAEQKADYAKKVADAEKKVVDEQKKVAAADAKYAAEISQNPGEESRIDAAKAAIDSASSRYYSAEEAYLSGEQAQLARHADSGIASADYNFALDAYRTELGSQRSLDDALVELQSRTLSEKANRDSQSDMIIYQFENAKAAALANLDKELEQQYEAMRNSEIRSSCDGVITDLRIEEGSAVQGGAAVANVTNFITTPDTPANVVESFVPAAEGKKIREGMTVKVYPSTANRNEYGHMEGKVLEVEDYVTSREDMINELGDTTLVDSFLRNGPVIRVTTTLQADPTTASGYFWSNQKGRDLTLETGTIVTTDTILERKAPITMLIPYLKDKFDSMSQKEVKDQQNGGQTGGEVNGGQQQ
jgi:NHLM bacteriocin system secretion protein